MAENKKAQSKRGRKALTAEQKKVLDSLGVTLTAKGAGRKAGPDTIATRKAVQSNAGKAAVVVFVPKDAEWTGKGKKVTVPGSASVLRDSLARFAQDNAVDYFPANGCYVVTPK